MTEDINLENIAIEICKQQELEFIRKEGVGAFKETFQVKEDDGLQLALKIYKSEDFDERSKREIIAMGKCDHPSIAKILSVDLIETEKGNFVFLVEAFFTGGTLADFTQKNGHLDKASIVNIGKDLIDAIAHLNQLDLVHRDIKPENILLDKDSKPIITDFGIVRDLNAISETQSWLMRGPGTPLYSAPEQLNNEKTLIDWRTDQFSLGITLSICAFGEHPYAHPSYSVKRIVDQVTIRGSTSDSFAKNIKNSGLFPLQKMVAVWPVERYLTPEKLMNDWNKLGG